MQSLPRSIAFVFLLSAPVAGVHAQDACKSAFAGAQEAVKRADVVVEADITTFSHDSGSVIPTDIIIEKIQTLFAAAPAKFRATVRVPIDACFPDRNRSLSLPVQTGMLGKRMRFYLSKGETADWSGYRVLFMQPVKEAPPAFPDTNKGFVTRAYPPSLNNALPDGWYVAHSTDGKYSIELPGSYEDVTRADGGQPGFMLRSADGDGVTYVAVFEPSGPGAKLDRAFDDASTKPGAVSARFKGRPAVATRSLLPAPNGKMVSHGLWIKAPGGTFMLAVAALEGQEPMVLKAKDRFFNSLKFE